jgi:hypothetical protein
MSAPENESGRAAEPRYAEARAAVSVTVEGYEVTSPCFEREELQEAAEDIAADIGMALCSLGQSCRGGTVTVTVDGQTATYPGGSAAAEGESS